MRGCRGPFAELVAKGLLQIGIQRDLARSCHEQRQTGTEERQRILKAIRHEEAVLKVNL